MSAVVHDSYGIRLGTIRLHGYHGCEPAEEKYGCTFEMTLDLTCAGRPDPEDDSLASYVDYAAVCKSAVEAFKDRRYKLIEPVAASVADRILGDFQNVKSVTVRLKKLRPLINADVECAEVIVTGIRNADATVLSSA